MIYEGAGKSRYSSPHQHTTQEREMERGERRSRGGGKAGGWGGERGRLECDSETDTISIQISCFLLSFTL